MDSDHIKRMYSEAKSRTNDADILSESIRAESDSASLLRILGFEILLKAAIFTCNLKPKNTHKYYKLWLALPGYAQKQILQKAKERMPGHTDFSDIEKLLNWYQYIFENARYFYELYEGYSLEEQHEIGEFWQEIGAPIEEADVQYFPNELECLIYGVSTYIENKAF
ncbi:MAG: hypothetical protein B6D75_08270 [gamma proteobacterium symbiont of Stewartia floridana]|nr:MAG: hypothetical protein B6D75_08270 [gamma proteobacterium symbiont of Stewartia floridana]